MSQGINPLLKAAEYIDQWGPLLSLCDVVLHDFAQTSCVCCSSLSCEQDRPSKICGINKAGVSKTVLCDNCGSMQLWTHCVDMKQSILKNTSKKSQEQDVWLKQVLAIEAKSLNFARMSVCIKCSFKCSITNHATSALRFPEPVLQVCDTHFVLPVNDDSLWAILQEASFSHSSHFVAYFNHGQVLS